MPESLEGIKKAGPKTFVFWRGRHGVKESFFETEREPPSKREREGENPLSPLVCLPSFLSQSLTRAVPYLSLLCSGGSRIEKNKRQATRAIANADIRRCRSNSKKLAAHVSPPPPAPCLPRRPPPPTTAPNEAPRGRPPQDDVPQHRLQPPRVQEELDARLRRPRGTPGSDAFFLAVGDGRRELLAWPGAARAHARARASTLTRSCRDVLSSQARPRAPEEAWRTAPLVVLHNFGGGGKRKRERARRGRPKPTSRSHCHEPLNGIWGGSSD